MLKKIHVSPNALQTNRDEKKREDALVVKGGRFDLRGIHVEIRGPSRLVLSRDGGAAWIETEAAVEVQHADGTSTALTA